MSSWIQTASGKRFFPLNPRVCDVDIEDIAHALSNQCRFTGHTREFYSVAEHSVRVSWLCDPVNRLWGLLHDASEAYLADVARPVKRSLSFTEYRRLEAAVQRAVCRKFRLPLEQPEQVHVADQRLLVTEKRDLMPCSHYRWNSMGPLVEPLEDVITPWGPSTAKKIFLQEFREIYLASGTNAVQYTT